MRAISVPVLAYALTCASPAFSNCDDRQTVFEPEAGKRGFRMVVWMPAAGETGVAHLYRPFRNSPEQYTVVLTGDKDRSFILVGTDDRRRLVVHGDGSAEMPPSREYPSRWRQKAC